MNCESMHKNNCCYITTIAARGINATRFLTCVDAKPRSAMFPARIYFCLLRLPGWLWLLLSALAALLLLRSPLRMMATELSALPAPAPIQRQQQCRPADKVVFVKTHKCASTTVQVS